MNSCVKVLIIGFLTLVVASCAGKTPQSDSSILSVTTFCTTARAIYWSKEDTRESITQIKEHNAVGKKLCGWKGKEGTW